MKPGKGREEASRLAMVNRAYPLGSNWLPASVSAWAPSGSYPAPASEVGVPFGS